MGRVTSLEQEPTFQNNGLFKLGPATRSSSDSKEQVPSQPVRTDDMFEPAHHRRTSRASVRQLVKIEIIAEEW